MQPYYTWSDLGGGLLVEVRASSTPVNTKVGLNTYSTWIMFGKDGQVLGGLRNESTTPSGTSTDWFVQLLPKLFSNSVAKMVDFLSPR
jgi:hypothetical protein